MGTHLTSYYHACIVYPSDYIRKYIGALATCDFMKMLDELALSLDCDFLASPLHTPDMADKSSNIPKEHFHILFRSPNKLTGNSFQCRLVDILRGDMRGVAYSASECCISKPNRYIRYMVHYDNPNKQSFRKENLAVFGNWNKELYDAFGDEMLSDMADLITSGACCSLRELVNIYDCGYALRQGHNMYFINSLISEMKKEIKK